MFYFFPIHSSRDARARARRQYEQRLQMQHMGQNENLHTVKITSYTASLIIFFLRFASNVAVSPQMAVVRWSRTCTTAQSIHSHLLLCGQFRAIYIFRCGRKWGVGSATSVKPSALNHAYANFTQTNIPIDCQTRRAVSDAAAEFIFSLIENFCLFSFLIFFCVRARDVEVMHKCHMNVEQFKKLLLHSSHRNIYIFGFGAVNLKAPSRAAK